MKKNILLTRGLVALPNITRQIKIGRQQSINSIKAVSKEAGKLMLITAQLDPKFEEVTKIDQIYTTGVIAKIISIEEKDSELLVTFKPTSRVLINTLELDETSKCFTSDYVVINDKKLSAENADKDFEIMLALLSRYDAKIAEKIKNTIAAKTKNNQVVNYLDVIYEITNELPIMFDQKQQVLSLNTLSMKIDALCGMLVKKADQTAVDKEVNTKINDSLNKQQKEFYLREKLRVVKEELGDLSSKENDANSLRKRLKENPYPKHIKEKIAEEINRLEASNPQETSMIRNYIEWLMDIPWWQECKDNDDINKVKDVLDESHYGLEKVKERIIEYLAVRAKSKNSKAPIICLVGPPGVGKSSLAKSIANAINKPFVKMALGGVKDESEIRGHRKTYLGSMPGRIIKAMKKSGVINPLFLLDEIDKMSSDQRGDPASAMLEVLDPEQNNSFSDNYIEEDYDLSKVMFVATANFAEQIPVALYDRLEIIELTSYTELEKLAIAIKYLMPKCLADSGLTSEELTITKQALIYMVSHYTREAGVRELERLIQKIARKHVVRQLTSTKVEKEVVDVKDIAKYLDKEIYEYTLSETTQLPGIVNGMAYTSAGGDLLQIEVSIFPGKGDIKITGNLKETMKESAEVAVSFVKSNAAKFGIKDVNFKEIDIHIHVPSGGIPKDGPSAGVTLTTAVISALTSRSIKNTISMTGEITLRGKVLIIGGIKEKTISAFRGGVNTIIIPRSDERFLKDVPSEVLDNITVYMVEQYDEIYDIVFNNKVNKATKVLLPKKKTNHDK